MEAGERQSTEDCDGFIDKKTAVKPQTFWKASDFLERARP